MPPPFPPSWMPGAAFLTIAVLLVAGLRRMREPLSWPLGLGYAAGVTVLLAPVLFGGRVLLPLDNLRGAPPFAALPPAEPHGNFLQGDLVHLVAPALHRVRLDLLAGRWPLLDDHVGGGTPLLADPQAQALQPIATVPLLAFGIAAGAGVTAALRLVIALLFMHLLLRHQGAGPGPATVGAVAWGLGGFVFLWLGWPIANVAALLPALLWAVVRLDEDPTAARAAVAAGTLALFLLGGHPETVLYGLLAAAALLLGRLAKTPGAARARRIRAVALAGLVGCGLASPALLPTIPAVLASARASREAAPGETPRSPRPVSRAVALVAPSALGNDRYGDSWGESNTNEDASGFVGTAALLLAALALLRPRTLRDGPVLLAVLAAGGVLLLLPIPPLLAAGGAGGGWHRILLLVGFALAWHAGAGAQALRALPRGWMVAAGAAVALAIAFAYRTGSSLPGAGGIPVYVEGWELRQLRVVALAAVVALLLARRRAAPWALAALVAMELVALHLPAWPPMPRSLAFPTPPSLEWLERRAGAARIVAIGDLLRPNLASLWGLHDVRAFNPVTPAAWERVTAPLVTERWSELPRFGRPADPLYDRLGVRWALAPPGADLPEPLALRYRGSEVWIWERPAADPVVAVRPRGAGASAATRIDASRWSAPAPGGGRLVTALLQDGGWRLVAGGSPVPTSPPGTLLEAELDSPATRAELLYRPPGFFAGLAAAALAFATAAAAWTRPRRRL